MDIDLNIDNYNLDDLLDIFKLNIRFNEQDLKHAYKQVLKTHPDKSGLDKKYFLFFSKAFKMVRQVYVYSHKKEQTCIDRKNTQYYQPNENELIDVSKMDAKNFNKKFNELFDKVKLDDEEVDTGYDSWFKSSDGLDTNLGKSIRSKMDMDAVFERKKKECRSNAIVKHSGIRDLGSNSTNGYGLTRERPDEYSSDVFSKLSYQDLKKAHTETVVPVTQEDFNNREHFSSVDELNRYRKANEGTLSQMQSEQLLQQKQKIEEEENMHRSYKMMRQMERINQSHELWNANFKQLTNG
jgi:hypothetical protein